MDLSNIDWGWILVNVAVLLFALSVHESAHAWTADRLGDHTSRYLGRITLNPVAHIDPVGTIFFPLLGILSGLAVFGWAKPVPVNPRNLRNPRRDHVFIAAAGPASNLVLAAFFLAGLKVLAPLAGSSALQGSSVPPFLMTLLLAGLFINVILAVFNLIPIPPLDGSWILAGLLPLQFSDLMDTIRPYSFLLLFLLLWAGFFRVILSPVLIFVRGLVL